MLWGTFTEMNSTAEDGQQSLMNNAGVERGKNFLRCDPHLKWIDHIDGQTKPVSG